MKRVDPTARPDADQLLRRWQRIRGQIFIHHRGARLRAKDETGLQTVVLDMIGVIRLGLLLSRRFVLWAVRLMLLFRNFC